MADEVVIVDYQYTYYRMIIIIRHLDTAPPVCFGTFGVIVAKIQAYHSG